MSTLLVLTKASFDSTDATYHAADLRTQDIAKNDLGAVLAVLVRVEFPRELAPSLPDLLQGRADQGQIEGFQGGHHISRLEHVHFARLFPPPCKCSEMF